MSDQRAVYEALEASRRAVEARERAAAEAKASSSGSSSPSISPLQEQNAGAVEDGTSGLFSELPEPMRSPLKYLKEARESKKAAQNDFKSEMYQLAPADGIVDEMKCGCCGSIPYPPSYTCKEGHLCCRRCLASKGNDEHFLPSCAYEFYDGRICEEPLFQWNNKLFACLYFNSQFLCPYVDVGCEEKPSGSKIREHTMNCRYRPNVRCPFTNCPVGKVSGVLYVYHVTTEHHVGLLETSMYRLRTDFARVDYEREFPATNVNEEGTRWVSNIFKVAGIYFAFIFEATPTSVLIWVSHMSEDENIAGREFQAHIGIKSLEGKRVKTWEGPVPKRCLKFKEIAAEAECFEISKTELRKKYVYEAGRKSYWNTDIKIWQVKKYQVQKEARVHGIKPTTAAVPPLAKLEEAAIPAQAVPPLTKETEEAEIPDPVVKSESAALVPFVPAESASEREGLALPGLLAIEATVKEAPVLPSASEFTDTEDMPPGLPVIEATAEEAPVLPSASEFTDAEDTPPDSPPATVEVHLKNNPFLAIATETHDEDEEPVDPASIEIEIEQLKDWQVPETRERDDSVRVVEFMSEVDRALEKIRSVYLSAPVVESTALLPVIPVEFAVEDTPAPVSIPIPVEDISVPGPVPDIESDAVTLVPPTAFESDAEIPVPVPAIESTEETPAPVPVSTLNIESDNAAESPVPVPVFDSVEEIPIPVPAPTIETAVAEETPVPVPAPTIETADAVKIPVPVPAIEFTDFDAEKTPPADSPPAIAKPDLKINPFLATKSNDEEEPVDPVSVEIMELENENENKQ